MSEISRIPVDELSKEQTRTVLMACKERMSKHYGFKLDMDENMADLIINIADESYTQPRKFLIPDDIEDEEETR